MSSLTTTLKRLVPYTVALVVVLSAVSLAAPTGYVLVVEDIDTGERYITQPVDNGTTVGLEYTHSVEKNRVYDVYRVNGTTLLNTRMEFESYGWGLPARVDVTNVDGTLVYQPPGGITELDALSVSPGRIANHTLVVGDQRYDLVAATDGSDVRIHIERRSPLAVFT